MIKKIEITILLILSIFIVISPAYAAPLTVHPSNPRYFTDGSGKAIYLTGSHTWGNLYDYAPPAAPFDFDGFLNLLTDNGHNFFRMWANHGNDGTSPVPWTKTNGKYNLNTLNQAYFDRLRARVIEARDRGIYTGIILFRPDNAKLGAGDWGVDPFNLNNNNNNLNGDTNNDGRGWEAYNGSVSGILSVQQAYVRKIIDTTYDLDNVIYEIANEAPSITANKQWQYNMIDYIKNYELTTYGKNHPVWMSAIFAAPGENWTPDDSFMTDPNNHADVVSPGSSSYKDNPPQNAGAKPIIADIDHIWPNEPQPAWIWKVFARGLMPIHMDSFTYASNPGSGISDQDQLDIRKYMGYTLTYANKINLAAMTPSSNSADCSTTYCLRNPGQEYLVYQPGSGAFTVNLQAGAYSYEWFNLLTGLVVQTGSIVAGAGNYTFTPPFSNDAVLYLKKTSVSPYCGDNSCNSGETCSSCPTDCGQCPSQDSIAYWKFDEIFGTTASDSSGNGNTGTLVNGPSWTIGKINGALSFDGVNDYVNISSNQIVVSNDWTISAWVKQISASSGAYRYVFLNGDDISGGGVSGFALETDLSTVPRFDIVIGIDAELNVTATTALSLNTWTHLAGVKNGTLLSIFVNGALNNSITLPSVTMDYTGNAPATRIGARSDALGNFPGFIDEIRVYNRALSQAEIQELYDVVTPSLYCGDSSCNNNETCSTCPGDCGTCPITHPELPGWTFCANENEQCSFSGTKEVQYGASSQYFSGIYTNIVLCANSIFGDPIVGVAKYCYWRDLADTTPPAPPTGVTVI